jgi:hypothetical protein
VQERIVVVFHGSPEVLRDSNAGYLEHVLSIRTSAEVYGASLCAWGGETFAFDFGPDELDEALSFAIEHVHDKHTEIRLGAGIAQGNVRELIDRGSSSGLSWGTPIVVAEQLARLARPGEVLLDPELAGARSGDLLLSGKRATELRGGVIVRGLRLDVAVPYRRDALARVSRLREVPPLIGREAELAKISLMPGFLGVIRARPGAGGTRMLREARKKIGAPRTLEITMAHLPREPLAALRAAWGRAMVTEQLPYLSSHQLEVFDAIVAGQGAGADAAAELLDAWLAPVEGRGGLLTIDDVGLVDSSTLDVVARAVVAKGFALIVRTDEEAPLPSALASLPTMFEVTLRPLPIDASVAIARAFCHDAITPEAARRWATRGGGLPLGIREALAEGLSSGELRWSGDLAEPRSATSGRGRAAKPEVWILRRARNLSTGARASLIALALLGGDAPVPMIDAIACLIEGPGARFALVETMLKSGGWVYSPEPDWVATSSRSLMQSIENALDVGARVMWHRMIWRTLEHHVSTLGLAELAYHAARSEEEHVAASLTASAAFGAANAGLTLAADELSLQARKFDPTVEVPVRIVESGDLSDDVTPVEPGKAIASLIEATIDELPVGIGGMAPISLRAPPDSLPISDPRPSVADALAALRADPAVEEDPDLMAARLPRLAKQALVEGDLGTLDQVLVSLRVTGEHEALVERMGAFHALAKGNHGEAFRRLSVVEEISGRDTRQGLAHAIALASSGAVDGALLTTLEALALARHERDYRGEQACARFLAYLSAAMGQPREASVWTRVAQDAVDSARG